MKLIRQILSVGGLVAAAFIHGSVTGVMAAPAGEFDEYDVYAELNNTDGDLGFHALIDGDPWRRLVIKDPNNKKILDTRVKGVLSQQGLTELFFESAEPPFDELTPDEFFARFPEGDYTIAAKTFDGGKLQNQGLFRHVMPAPPEPTVNGVPMPIQCDDEEPGYDIVVVDYPVVIEWPEVDTSHPTVGQPGEITAALYQVVVEAELDINGEEFVSVFSVDLPPDERSMTIPEEVLELVDEFKFEVLAKDAEGGNQTAVESCFAIEEGEEDDEG